jgi:hypothetical protein
MKQGALLFQGVYVLVFSLTVSCSAVDGLAKDADANTFEK